MTSPESHAPRGPCSPVEARSAMRRVNSRRHSARTALPCLVEDEAGPALGGGPGRPGCGMGFPGPPCPQAVQCPASSHPTRTWASGAESSPEPNSGSKSADDLSGCCSLGRGGISTPVTLPPLWGQSAPRVLPAGPMAPPCMEVFLPQRTAVGVQALSTMKLED